MIDLLQEGIDILREHPEIQCKGSLKMGDFMCAEGPFAQILINHFPERFAWTSNGEGQFRFRDRAKTYSDSHTPLSFHNLMPDHWNLLHPNGNRIATMVAAAFGHNQVASANDHTDTTFTQFADKFQFIKDKVGTDQRCDHCNQIFVTFDSSNRLCMVCELVEMQRQAAIAAELNGK